MEGEGGWGGGKRFITAFYLLWVSLIPWPCTDWSVKINSCDQMSGPELLSVVILTLWGLTCGQVGMWIKMEMPLEGRTYPKHLLVAECSGWTLAGLPSLPTHSKSLLPILLLVLKQKRIFHTDKWNVPSPDFLLCCCNGYYGHYRSASTIKSNSKS